MNPCCIAGPSPLLSDKGAKRTEQARIPSRNEIDVRTRGDCKRIYRKWTSGNCEKQADAEPLGNLWPSPRLIAGPWLGPGAMTCPAASSGARGQESPTAAPVRSCCHGGSPAVPRGKRPARRRPLRRDAWRPHTNQGPADMGSAVGQSHAYTRIVSPFAAPNASSTWMPSAVPGAAS